MVEKSQDFVTWESIREFRILFRPFLVSLVGLAVLSRGRCRTHKNRVVVQK